MFHLTRFIVLFLCFSLLGCASTSKRVPAGADVAPNDEAAVLDAVDRFLEAMGSRDTVAYTDLQTPDGMTYTQKKLEGQWRLLRRTNQHHIDTLDDKTDLLSETYWEPTVLIRGPIAVVWAPYQFRINGNVSHCGVDVFEMLKIDGRWVMGNAMWTAEPEACEELRPCAGAKVRPAKRK
jgi:hypothetical protein